MKLPIVFWGSSDLSVPFLQFLIEKESVNLISVITHQEQPRGRGLKLSKTPLHEYAHELKLPVYTADKINTEEFFNYFENLKPQLSVVISYGKLIPVKVINMHKIGMLNVHFSLLPKYRGASPIQTALMRGEETTGVSIFWLDEKLDTGDIFLQEAIKIDINDDYFSLSKKLIEIAKKMLEKCIKNILEGKIIKLKQKGSESYAPPITKSISDIDWNESSLSIHNLVRALVYWPKAQTHFFFRGKLITVKILKTELVGVHDSNDYLAGSIVSTAKNDFKIKCGKNSIIKVIKLQPENGKVMDADDFIHGYRVKIGDKFVSKKRISFYG